MFDTNNYIHMDNRRDADLWQIEEDAKAQELDEAVHQIRRGDWDTYERDMEIYALSHELQNWGSMWEQEELVSELTQIYKSRPEQFVRIYYGAYTTLHPEDLARYVNDHFYR